ncbi:alpha-(1,3)-fucosyltransferase C-like [Spodoptera frugiperda]|uniref:Fucosyltransferase n=1 Tax=Spodoptera frugiperda TaxID=7108 RepID=A0A9R0EUN6_SPOFR|nr:alpha-(1,3)-fucosyltransferase C-like [Spodoptera frugiperda]
MFKISRIIIVCGYTYFLIQYLKLSLKPVITEINIEYVYRLPRTMNKHNKMLTTHYNVSTYLRSYRKPERFKTDLKFILKFTATFSESGTFVLFKNGQSPFIENNCTYYNCYLTTNKKYLRDLRDFDAIVYDVEHYWDGQVMLRHPYQKFIFMASESAANFPLCDDLYDDYYNLTWTYKLNSDIRWTYITITDKKDNFVGPKINMTWVDPMEPTPEEVKQKIAGKKKAAAWFVSNCKAKSGRQNVTMMIEKELKRYDKNLTVDVYGFCGQKKCPKDNIEECLFLLQSDYYFYMAFENSICEDYVTEKVLYPLQNYAVPIVFGGANYSRFLPPGSYINARELSASQVANLIFKAMNNPKIYEDYFRWHNHYNYVKTPPNHDICKLCQILNEDGGKHSSYKHFRTWWNPDYPSMCTRGVGKFIGMKPNSMMVAEAERK